MIVSHENKFIFLKTRKTAGTSIEIGLSRLCGSKDIITPVLPEDESIRKSLGYPGPQNYYLPLRNYTLRNWARLLIRGKPQQYFNHQTAELVCEFLGREVWESYFKFCFERNPWDKAISLYYWMTKDNEDPVDFETFLYSYNLDRLSNFSIYSIDGKISVDFLGKFEQLEDGLAKVAERLNLQESIVIPKAKSGVRKEKQPYQKIINDNAREYIRRNCSREIEHLGYVF